MVHENLTLALPFGENPVATHCIRNMMSFSTFIIRWMYNNQLSKSNGCSQKYIRRRGEKDWHSYRVFPRLEKGWLFFCRRRRRQTRRHHHSNINLSQFFSPHNQVLARDLRQVEWWDIEMFRMSQMAQHSVINSSQLWSPCTNLLPGVVTRGAFAYHRHDAR